MLLVPCTPAADGITINISINGGFITATIPTTDIDKLEAAMRYRVKITITPVAMQVTGVDVLPWDDETVGGDGNVYYPDEQVPGIKVPASDINLGGSDCSASVKEYLSKLRWAEGNLKSTAANDLEWVSPDATGTDAYGYYYTYLSTYTGDTSENGTDPCTKLASKYGTGWRTPSEATLQKLAYCTDRQIVIHNGTSGVWFLNKTKGLFLPAAGNRNYTEGSGTTATRNAGTNGYYWSRDANDSNNGYNLGFSSGNASTSNSHRTNG